MARLPAAFGAAVLLAAAGLTAQAAPEVKPEGRAAVLQKVIDCRKLADGAARLACYDAAVTSLDQAEAKGDVVVVDREQARKVRRQAFGFSLPSISLFERGESKEQIENIASTVRSARQNGAGKWVVELADGGTWLQVDNNELFSDPKPGQPVKVRHASLGSFLMTIGNGSAIRVHRIE